WAHDRGPAVHRGLRALTPPPTPVAPRRAILRMSVDQTAPQMLATLGALPALRFLLPRLDWPAPVCFPAPPSAALPHRATAALRPNQARQPDRPREASPVDVQPGQNRSHPSPKSPRTCRAIPPPADSTAAWPPAAAETIPP